MTAPLFWPAPLAFDDSPAVLELQTLTGDPDAAIYALRLWHHARRCGFDTLLSAGALERVATNGRPKKGRLLKALVEAGIVAPVESSNHYMIIPWQDCAVVEWTRPGEDAADDDADTEPEEDAKERRRRLDRERKLRKRSGHDADNSADSADSEADISAVEADTKRTDADKDPVNGRYSPRAPARATETETKTETDTETSEDQKPSVAVAPVAPKDSLDELFDTPRQEPTTTKPKRPRKVDGLEADALRWLDHYRLLTNSTEAAAPDSKVFRTRYYAARKTGNRTHEDLLKALSRTLNEPFWSGKGMMAHLSEAAIQAGLAPPPVVPKPAWQVQEVVRKPDYFERPPPEAPRTPEQDAEVRRIIRETADKLAGRAPAEASDDGLGAD